MNAILILVLGFVAYEYVTGRNVSASTQGGDGQSGGSVGASGGAGQAATGKNKGAKFTPPTATTGGGGAERRLYDSYNALSGRPLAKIQDDLGIETVDNSWLYDLFVRAHYED